MNVRKLQGEIDKTLKKVSEGILEFDSILKKVYSATSSNQKEKYETDLKKEIKKLQRYRDQIKAWISSNDVKNKTSLMDSRKSIEQKMEQFKACEKETKTKAYSKEGLDMSSKDEMAKSHVRSWVGKAIIDLKSQIESFENELENIPVRKRKTEATRVESLQKYLQNHKYHQKALECLLRMLEVDKVTSDDIESLKDSIDCYLDGYEDENQYEDPEDVYNEFNLKLSDEDYDLSIDDSADEGLSTDSGGGQDDNDDSSTTNNNNNGHHHDNQDDTTTSNIATTSSSQNSTNKSNSPPITSTSQQQSSSSSSSTSTISPIPLNNSSSSNSQRMASPPTVGGGSNQQQQQPLGTSRNTTPSPTFSSVTKSNIKSDNVKQNTPQHQQQPSQQPQPSQQQQYPLGNVPMSQRLQMQQQLMQQQQQQQQQTQQQQQQQQGNYSMRKGSQPQQPQTQPQQPQQPQQQTQQSQTSPQQQQQTSPYQQPGPSQIYNQQTNPDVHDIQESLQQMNLKQQQQQQIQHQYQQQYQQQQQDTDDIKNNETFDSSASNLYPGTLAELSSATMSRIANSEGPVISSYPQMGIPTGSNIMSQQPLQSEEIYTHTRHMIETSFKNLPDFKDYERIPTYIPKNQKQTPPYYPQMPLPIFESPNIFEKFDIDTLFFIFYFKQGTYQQYQAAKELKKQGWRYHKKYLTWFRRHEEPKEINTEYEQGTYVYFDYETGWCQRKKTEFTFEYRYLEE
eukprot:gene6754-8376_t